MTTDTDVQTTPDIRKMSRINITWLWLSLLGAIAIAGFSVLWTKEVLFYGRNIIFKLDAVVIVVMAVLLVIYCIAAFKGRRPEGFKSESIAFWEIGALCFFPVTAIMMVIMGTDILTWGSGDWKNGLDVFYYPALIATLLFTVAIFKVMRWRHRVGVESLKQAPSKWSPLWYIAVLISVVLYIYAFMAAMVYFLYEPGEGIEKYLALGVLGLGLGYFAYLFSLRSSVKSGELLSRGPLYLEIFAYAAIAGGLFVGLFALPELLFKFDHHYGWSLGRQSNFVGMVRFTMPALCLGLAGITAWLIRVRWRLPRDENF